MPKFIPILFFSVFALASCDLYRQDTFEPEYVIESYLVANRNLPLVRVSQTMPVGAEYTFDEAAAIQATVEIRLLSNREQGTVEQNFYYLRITPGVYAPWNEHFVLPERRYELVVTLPENGTVIRSVTQVPGQFESVGEPADSITYQNPQQVVLNTTPSFYPGRQTFFIFNVNVLNPDPENLTPFYADLVNNQDENIAGYYKNSSGIINEKNYEQNADSTLTLKIPWLAVAFFEDNYIIANAIDDNMYDFYRSQNIQSGRSILPPGELQNAIYNVEGGIGVFGSMATDTVRVYVKRNN